MAYSDSICGKLHDQPDIHAQKRECQVDFCGPSFPAVWSCGMFFAVFWPVFEVYLRLRQLYKLGDLSIISVSWIFCARFSCAHAVSPAKPLLQCIPTA